MRRYSEGELLLNDLLESVTRSWKSGISSLIHSEDTIRTRITSAQLLRRTLSEKTLHLVFKQLSDSQSPCNSTFKASALSNINLFYCTELEIMLISFARSFRVEKDTRRKLTRTNLRRFLLAACISIYCSTCALRAISLNFVKSQYFEQVQKRVLWHLIPEHTFRQQTTDQFSALRL